MRNTLWGRCWIACALMFVVACVQPSITHCPDVDCPKDEVCDGQGGCALPEQLEQCNGKSTGAACAYTGKDGAHVEGSCSNNICVPLGCGNFLVSANEVCDDGNTTNGDGCSADCLSNETCGNGVVDPAKGEQCDDANAVDGDGCQHDCKNPRCGDGIVDATLNEDCDAGAANSMSADAACRPNCQFPRCGDGVVDTQHGEVCDDGNNNPGDGCAGDCKSNETCGNSTVDVFAGEVCDDGNTASNDGCRGDCKSTEACGNNVLDTARGEVCDDGNIVSGDGCSSDCRSLEVCGNGVLDTIYEQCDLGTSNSNAPDSPCRTNCKFPACGDAIKDPNHNEQCDAGMMNANVADACRTNCQLPRCGDTIKDSAEACDDGNYLSGDGCSGDCRSNETCGNGYIDTAKGEQCDAGASNSNAANSACRLDCKLPRCGDGVTDTSLGESCDAGAANSNSPNAACRTNCQPQRCADGVLDNLKGEVCDDGNVVSGDGCSADCKSLETCGNSIVDTAKGEQCDAGAQNSNAPNATCRTTCKLPRCGDNILDNLLNESCDLGVSNSDAANATCRTNCQPQRCGDKIVDNLKSEVCDDGNFVSGDGCSADCKSSEVCGNGIVDVAKNEQCDNGGLNANTANATCRLDCTRQKCGDSIVDNAFGEVCDLGASNSNAANATCRLNCTPQRCGDGILDSAKGEVCDDANNTSGDGCSADCKSLETCGNGIIDTAKGEECDAGGANSNAPNSACRVGCKLPKCGDGIVDNLKGEVCDAGVNNSNNPDAVCRLTCVLPACGDGVTDPLRGEVCDDANTNSGDGCRSDCKSNETCGNGVLDPQKGEQCDDGNTRSYDGCSACAPESILVLTPGSAPPARDLEVLVYDGARQRTVMFGGRGTSSNLDDTWQWDGTSWTKLVPPHAPAPRYGAASAYDAKRNRIVLFGGTTANGIAADTWEFDGADWVQKTPTSSPLGRTGAAMAYDANRGKVIMFGGTNGSTANQETYEWTGVTWNLLAPTFKPAARSGARMAFDSANKYVLMFGGSAADTHTYAFDATGNWVDKGSTAGPTTGADANAIAFDANVGKVVLWGGTASTYEWSGAAWTAIAGGPTTPRSNVVGTYDAIRKQVVLFGGYTGATQYADTWVRSLSTWSQPAALTLPPARMRASMAYDPLRKKTVMFGGQNTQSRLTGCTTNTCSMQDVWEWDGTKWAAGNSTGVPSVRASTWMDYDVNAQTLRLYGGDYVQKSPTCKVTIYNDVYRYNSATGWSLESTSSSGRTNTRLAAAAFDSATNHFLTFAGVDNDNCNSYGTLTNATWYWDSTGWHQQSISAPLARDNTAMAYDRVRNKTVLFSGNPRDGSTVADTWEYNGSSWTKITTASTPNPRFNHRLFFNPDAGVVTMFGNSGYATGEDVWQYNGTTWTQRTQLGTYPTRYSPSATYDASSHAIVAFGGRNNDLISFGATNSFGLLMSRPNTAPEACTSSVVDYDKDGKSGCVDDDCWSTCDPLHPPGTTRPAGAPYCGNGVCNSTFESCMTCPGDCGACTGKCGDFNCDSGETAATCPNDC